MKVQSLERFRYSVSNRTGILSINQQQSEMENSSENIKYLFKMMGISKMLILRRQF